MLKIAFPTSTVKVELEGQIDTVAPLMKDQLVR
jgi:hypothetical protein